MKIVATIRNPNEEMACERDGELSPHELSALREIQLTGQTSNHILARKFLNGDIVVKSQDGYLQLTVKGRRLFVRGSPLLWNIVS